MASEAGGEAAILRRGGFGGGIGCRDGGEAGQLMGLTGKKNPKKAVFMYWTPFCLYLLYCPAN